MECFRRGRPNGDETFFTYCYSWLNGPFVQANVGHQLSKSLLASPFSLQTRSPKGALGMECNIRDGRERSKVMEALRD